MSTSDDVEYLVSLLENFTLEDLKDNYKLLTDRILRSWHCTVEEYKLVIAYDHILYKKYQEEDDIEEWMMSETAGRAAKIGKIALSSARTSDDTVYCCFCGGRLTVSEAACNFGGYFGPAHEGCARAAYRQHEIQMSHNPFPF